MKTIGILANCKKLSAKQVLCHLAEKATAHGFSLVSSGQTAELLPNSKHVSPESFAEHIDMLIVLGGDGTMLKAVRMLQGRNIPILGVNLGSLGFLTNVPEDDIDSALECLAEKKFSVSSRALIECVVNRNDEEKGRYCALNDIVIERGASPRIITLNILIDNEDVSSCMCDGLIVSTPTGSTGHSLSAGGPVLHPDVDAFVLSLICPHTLSTRPLVVPYDKKITVVAEDSAGDLLLTVDGQVGEPLKQDDRVMIRLSDQRASFIKLPGFSYFSILRQKLHWRGSTV